MNKIRGLRNIKVIALNRLIVSRTFSPVNSTMPAIILLKGDLPEFA
jgi:hypothetical protein